jgi:Zn ribbon nucleic-acid-binding protein
MKFQCPACKTSGALRIFVMTRFKLSVSKDGDVEDFERDRDFEWDDDHFSECTDCGWDGTVAEMTVEDGEIQSEDAKEREEDQS